MGDLVRSNAPKLVINPRGFISRVGDDVLGHYKTKQDFHEQVSFVKVSDIEQTDPILIDTLWNEYRSKMTSTIPADLYLRFCGEIAKRFGDFHNWLHATVHYVPNSSVSALEFIKDTLTFVETGYRNIPLSAQIELLSVDPTDIQSGDKPTFNDVYIPTTDELISKWSQHPRGIDDLFFTAYILFGQTE